MGLASMVWALRRTGSVQAWIGSQANRTGCNSIKSICWFFFSFFFPHFLSLKIKKTGLSLLSLVYSATAEASSPARLFSPARWLPANRRRRRRAGEESSSVSIFLPF